MEIYINSAPVDFALQDEATAGEVVKNLHAWLSAQGWGVQQVSIDGEDILYRHGWNTQAPTTIGHIAIEASPLAELRKTSLEALWQWAREMHARVEALSRREGSLADILALIGHYGHLQGALGFLCEYDPAPYRMLDGETRRALDQHIADLTRDDGSFNADELPRFALTVYNLVVMCQDRLKELEDPQEELQRLQPLVEGLMAELGDTGIQLQTGREKEAFARIFTLTEILNKIFRLFWLSAQGGLGKVAEDPAPLEAWVEDSSPVLGAIQEAMGAGDHVMLGDLLEYELAPALERLRTIMPQRTAP